MIVGSSYSCWPGVAAPGKPPDRWPHGAWTRRLAAFPRRHGFCSARAAMPYGKDTTNAAVLNWVDTVARHTQPSWIHWCDGSDEERAGLEREMVAAGSLIELDPKLHPRSFLHRSDPRDVARTEHLTFISTERKEDAGPTNNWMSAEEAQQRVWSLFAGSMRGRTLYV